MIAGELPKPTRYKNPKFESAYEANSANYGCKVCGTGQLFPAPPNGWIAILCEPCSKSWPCHNCGQPVGDHNWGIPECPVTIISPKGPPKDDRNSPTSLPPINPRGGGSLPPIRPRGGGSLPPLSPSGSSGSPPLGDGPDTYAGDEDDFNEIDTTDDEDDFNEIDTTDDEDDFNEIDTTDDEDDFNEIEPNPYDLDPPGTTLPPIRMPSGEPQTPNAPTQVDSTAGDEDDFNEIDTTDDEDDFNEIEPNPYDLDPPGTTLPPIRMPSGEPQTPNAPTQVDSTDGDEDGFIEIDATDDEGEVIEIDATDDEGEVIEIDATDDEGEVIEIDATDDEGEVIEIDATDDEGEVIEIDATDDEGEVIEIDATDDEGEVIEIDATDDEGEVIEIDATDDEGEAIEIDATDDEDADRSELDEGEVIDVDATDDEDEAIEIDLIDDEDADRSELDDDGRKVLGGEGDLKDMEFVSDRIRPKSPGEEAAPHILKANRSIMGELLKAAEKEGFRSHPSLGRLHQGMDALVKGGLAGDGAMMQTAGQELAKELAAEGFGELAQKVAIRAGIGAVAAPATIVYTAVDIGVTVMCFGATIAGYPGLATEIQSNADWVSLPGLIGKVGTAIGETYGTSPPAP